MATEHHVNFAATGPSTPPLQREGGVQQSGNTEMKLPEFEQAKGKNVSEEIPFSRYVSVDQEKEGQELDGKKRLKRRKQWLNGSRDVCMNEVGAAVSLGGRPRV